MATKSNGSKSSESKSLTSSASPMMFEHRHVRWSRYGLALVATMCILGLVLATSWMVETLRVQDADMNSRELRTEYESLQVQELYLSLVASKNESCAVFSSALTGAVKKLSSSLEAVENARTRDTTGLTRKELLLIERQYLNDNLRYWLVAKKAKESCGLDIVTVLYFTSTNDCSACASQGAILSYFKRKLGERLLIFPLNTALENEEPVLSLLRVQYGIETVPGVVIEDEVFPTGVSREEFEGVLSKKFFNTTGLGE